MKEQIANKDQAFETLLKINGSPRSGWIAKGSRAKSNENIELPRELAKELANKTIYFYQTLELLPCDPFCNCSEIEGLLQKAVQELPEGDTVDELEQIMFRFCPSCGKKFERKRGEGKYGKGISNSMDKGTQGNPNIRKPIKS